VQRGAVRFLAPPYVQVGQRVGDFLRCALYLRRQCSYNFSAAPSFLSLRSFFDDDLSAPRQRCTLAHCDMSDPCVIAGSGSNVAGNVVPLQDPSIQAVVEFLRASGGGGALSDVQIVARKSGLAEVAVLVAAAANEPARQPQKLLLLSNLTPLAGWGGSAVAGAVEQWARHECSYEKFWKLDPPPALIDDARGVAAADGQTSFSVHILSLGSFALVPPVKDELVRDSSAQFVLLLTVRPSPVLALLVNTRSNGSAAEQWRRASAATSNTVIPTAVALCLTCERSQAATTSPLDPSRMRNAIATAAQYANDDLSGARIAFAELPTEYAVRATLTSELASRDWKSAALWLEDDTSPSWQLRQDEAVLHKALAYAISFLTLHGGGELQLGVWDRSPRAGGVEGIISAASPLGSATHAKMLEEQLRRVLQVAVMPWRDEWLRIVAVPVQLDASCLLPATNVLDAGTVGLAADSILVAEFVDERAITFLRRACKGDAPCASLPLPLLDTIYNTLPDSMEKSPCVFRAPLSPEKASVLVAQLKAAKESGSVTLTPVCAADVVARLPALHVLHVQFAGAAPELAACSPFDVAAPVFTPGRGLRYLPWRDIVSRVLWEQAPRVSLLAARLASPALRVHCWNISSAPASRALFDTLRRLPLTASWLCADLADAPREAWGAADLLSVDGLADTLLMLLCEPLAEQAADEAFNTKLAAAFGSLDGPSLLLATASQARVIAVSSSATHASNALSAAASVAPFPAAAAALRAAEVVPPAAVTPSSGLAPKSLLPPPASPKEVKEAAKRLLRGESLPPSQLLQLLKLPAGSCVVFEREQHQAVFAALNLAVAAAVKRACTQYLQLARRHVAAGAALLAMRCLVECGCDPLLVADADVGKQHIVQS
jgi:hypothetical protein